nr:MAG TPA: hypothetical protein [Caudoviricetes sp.]
MLIFFNVEVAGKTTVLRFVPLKSTDSNLLHPLRFKLPDKVETPYKVSFLRFGQLTFIAIGLNCIVPLIFLESALNSSSLSPDNSNVSPIDLSANSPKLV